MKLIKFIAVLITISIIIAGYFIYQNIYGYRYVNGDYKNIFIGNSKNLVMKKLNYLLKVGEISLSSSSHYAAEQCKIPYNFEVQYFNKSIDVICEYYKDKLDRVRFGGWSEYRQNEFKTKLKDASTYFLASLKEQYGKPQIEDKYPDDNTLTKVSSENFPYGSWILGKWVLPKKIIELKVYMTVYADGKSGWGGYSIEIRSRIEKNVKKDIKEKIKNDF